MPLLLWKAILDAKDRGLSLFDLGRTDADNSGLLTFKERLGATPSTLTYVRWADASRKSSARDISPGAARVFARLPDELLVAAGSSSTVTWASYQRVWDGRRRAAVN